MWSGKMAAQWRKEDGALNAGNSDFLRVNASNEFSLCGGDMVGLEMDPQSCMDHSILAIFDDPAISSEDKRGVEDETLLSALTEMLDCVEDDVEILSPFDMLPDTKLLNYQQCRDKTKEGLFAIEKPKVPNSPFTRNEDCQQLGKSENQSPAKKPSEDEVEIFTSMSLVNLVKIMHPYCLRLEVEEMRGSASSHASEKSMLFSKEEVWKYKRPSGDSDEEINVVSDDDDETPAHTKEEEHGYAKKYYSKPLRSVLVNSHSPRTQGVREKKKVSFGQVHVVSYDEFVEPDCGNLREISEPLLAQENPTNSPEAAAELATKTIEDSPPKAKALSLQQYRQLRHKRLPRVEKQRNQTTRWPSVPEPPKELTPILCLHGQSSVTPKTSWTPSDCTRISTSQDQSSKLSGLDPAGPAPRVPLPHCPRTKLSLIPPANPQRKNVQVCKSPSKKSPSVDPPNPVLLPLTPALQKVESETERSAQEIKSDPRKTHSDASSGPNVSEAPDATTQTTSQSIDPQLPRPTCEPCPTGKSAESKSSTAPVQSNVKNPISISPPEEPPPLLGQDQRSTCDSGIEATDVTSLLEQFEEKQAKGEHESETSNSTGTTSPSDSLDPTVESGQTLPPSLTTVVAAEPSQEAQGRVDFPESVPVEVTVSTQGGRATQRTSAASKAIQIIDPRPLPSRKNSCTSELSTSHTCQTVSSDHDYCAPSSATLSYRVKTANSSVKADKNHSTSAQKKTFSPKDSETDLSLLDCAHPCGLPTPPPSPPSRGRQKRRYRCRSRRSDSSSSSSSASSSSSGSSSRSRSPKRSRRSRSSSGSSSGSRSPPPHYRLPRCRSGGSRSRSRSWSRSRSPSPSLAYFRQRRNVYRSSLESRKLQREQDLSLQKLKAIDERRVVYVGRIRRSMTHDELRERFSQFGEVECVSLHFRDKGDHYGFVTFYHTEDAFSAIDNGVKLRRPDELPFDICFGGRRQFCKSSYADLDANRGPDLFPARSRFEQLDFDSLLKEAQRGKKGAAAHC